MHTKQGALLYRTSCPARAQGPGLHVQRFQWEPMSSFMNRTPSGTDGGPLGEAPPSSADAAEVRQHTESVCCPAPAHMCAGPPQLDTEHLSFPDLRTHSSLLHLENIQIFSKFMFEIPKSTLQFFSICEYKPLKFQRKEI